ncbi:MAG: GNAT family N-acetyltransferase [Polyangiales bacterium]
MVQINPSSSVDIPAFDSERLTFRGHRLTDFDESAAMWADEEVTRYIGGRPFTKEEVWARLHRYVGHWALMGFGYWVIREKTSQRFVGEVGLADFKRDIAPAFDGSAESGWALARWAHGLGFATEALTAALRWFANRDPSMRTVCLIDPGNVRSIRVAEKCGYQWWTRGTYKGQPCALYERPSGVFEPVADGGE